MKIELQDYDPYWPENFAIEKKHLKLILPNGSVIEHIGSTSVVGLCAKPIIDILCGIDDFSQADSLIYKIVGLDY